MSLGDWTSWNNRTTRRREDVVDVFVPERPRSEPMKVEESDPSATWIGRIFRWPKGTP